MKVFKKVNDCVTSFMGEPVQIEDGKEFFELSEEMKESAGSYIHHLVWPDTTTEEVQNAAPEGDTTTA